jgi:hypothetical protein
MQSNIIHYYIFVWLIINFIIKGEHNHKKFLETQAVDLKQTSIKEIVI